MTTPDARSSAGARPDGEPDVTSLRTIDQLVRRAEAVLDAGPWEFGRCGGGEEVTLARNRAAWRQLALVPAVLRDVSAIDLSTTFLGQELALPVLCAPVGALGIFHPDGAAASAMGCAGEGTIGVIGVLSSPSFSEVQQRSGGRNIFQIYISGDERWVDALVERVGEAGAAGLCVTVDSAVHARRDRLLDGDFDWRVETGGAMPPNLEGLGRQRGFQASFTWAALERLRARTDLPIVLKGVMTAEDARRAVDVGVEAVYVSNHGGRGLDHGLSTVEVLQDVVDAVGGRAEVVLDSGVRHGTDVCKAVALGARAVLIGRLQCWGLAVGGADGVAQVLRILRAEMENTMALMGVRALRELTPTKVRSTIPV